MGKSDEEKTDHTITVNDNESTLLKSDETKNNDFGFFTSAVGENGKESSEEKKKRLSNNFFLSDLSLDD